MIISEWQFYECFMILMDASQLSFKIYRVFIRKKTENTPFWAEYGSKIARISVKPCRKPPPPLPNTILKTQVLRQETVAT